MLRIAAIAIVQCDTLPTLIKPLGLDVTLFVCVARDKAIELHQLATIAIVVGDLLLIGVGQRADASPRVIAVASGEGVDTAGGDVIVLGCCDTLPQLGQSVH